MQVFSERMIHYLIQSHHSEMEKAKITYGVRMLLSDLYKLVAVYGVALLLGCWLEVLVMHFTFYFLRQVGLGYHFSSERQCVLWSIVLFPVLCSIRLSMPFEDDVLLLIISGMIFLIATPVGTKKFTVTSPIHRHYLRKKGWIRLTIILIAYYWFPPHLQPFIVLGVSIEVLMMMIQMILNIKESYI